MREWIDKLLTSLKEGLPAWTRAIREIRPEVLALTNIISDLLVEIRKDAVKLDEAERADITNWVAKLKKAGLASADIAYLVVSMEQARGARKDAFTQTLMHVSKGLTGALVPFLMQEATDGKATLSITELLEKLQDLTIDPEAAPESEDQTDG